MVARNELIERWTPERAREAAAALETWKKKRRLEDAAFGVHEGRLDFRGLPIYTGVGGMFTKSVAAEDVSREYTFVTLENPPEFHSVHWERLDFSDAEIDHLRFFLSEIRDCKFTNAIIRDRRNWGTRYFNCDFTGADMQRSGIGGKKYRHVGAVGRGGRARRDVAGRRRKQTSGCDRVRGREMLYEDCVFNDANFLHASLSGATYTRCSFVNVTIADEHIRDTKFQDCVFVVKFVDVNIDGRSSEVAGCDFSNCKLDGVRLIGVDARTITLPKNQGMFIPKFREVVQHALQWVKTTDKLTPEESRIFEMALDAPKSDVLPADAEGWVDLGVWKGRTGELLLDAYKAGMDAAGVTPRQPPG